MNSRGKSLPVVGSSKCKAQGWERHLGELWFCDSHWLEWRCEIGLCQFTCFMTLNKSCNLSDYKLLPGISKGTWFNKHLWNILCEPGTVSGWCWAYGDVSKLQIPTHRKHMVSWKRQTPCTVLLRTMNKAPERRRQLTLLKEEVMSKCSTKWTEKKAFHIKQRQGGRKRH